MDSLRLGALMLIGLTTAGCETVSEQPAPAGPQTVSPGSTIEVLQGFPVTVRASGTYFQDGEIIEGAAVRHGYPYCRFQLEPPVEHVKTVAPQVFRVRDVSQRERTTRSGRRSIAYTVLELAGGAQSEGARLQCRWPWVVGDTRWTTPSEIQGAVSGYMKLSLAP
jgi:hypothetical protein